MLATNWRGPETNTGRQRGQCVSTGAESFPQSNEYEDKRVDRRSFPDAGAVQDNGSAIKCAAAALSEVKL
jgi:hypothetical protein